MKTTRFAQESAAQAQAEAKENLPTLRQLLITLDSPDVSERQRWMALRFILREFMLSQGVDLDYPITD